MLLYRLIALLAILISNLTFSLILEIRWRRPRVLGYPGDFTNFVNAPADFLRLYKKVFFDVCPLSVDHSEEIESGFSHQWTIFGVQNSNNSILHTFIGPHCLHEWVAPTEGEYNISVTIFKNNQTTIISTQFFVRDIWLVALGDSFASGQGNPDVPFSNRTHPSRWVNDSCFRASYGSYSYLVYDILTTTYPRHGFLFTYLACSSATVRQGLLGPQPEQELAQVTDSLNPIIKAAKELASASSDSHSKTKPDLILLAIGANDIGFFDVTVEVMMGTLTFESSFNRLQLPEKFSNLTDSLRELNDDFKRNGIDSSSVFYFEYFDPLRNENGQFDSNCAGMLFATDDDFRIAYNSVLKPLNALIKNRSSEFGWHCVDNIAEAFFTRGICSKKSFIRNMVDSLRIQGSGVGTYHPTYVGHKMVAEKAWPKIAAYMEKRF